MKLPIGFNKSILYIVLTMYSTAALAQVTQENPLQYIAIEEGNSLVNGEISSQTKTMRQIVEKQTVIGGEMAQIKEWENKYNSYLKTARGYAEMIKAGTTLYTEGIRTLQNLCQIRRAVNANPQGIGATLAMNDLYVETATELIQTYRLLRISIAKGGEENMLNGAERTELLWTLSEQLATMNRKFHKLAVSIAYYNLSDVWRKATAGMGDKSHGQIAGEAMERWKRAQNVNRILSK